MSTYLHFDLGSNRDAYEQILDELRINSARPSDLAAVETSSRYTISAPIEMKSELEAVVGSIGRLIDEMDYDPCTIELRHISAQICHDGVLLTAPSVNGIWQGADTKYVATALRITELHHLVTIRKSGNRPPAAPDGWSVTEHSEEWRFELRKPAKSGAESSLSREHEKIASLYKGVTGAVASRVEQVVARWNTPLEPAQHNQYRVPFTRLVGASPRHALDFPAIYEEIRNNHDHPFLKGEELQARILENLEPFRRIVKRQGCTPLVLGLGLVPVVPNNGLLKFGDRFCVRGVAYGKTVIEAQLLVGVFDELIYQVVKTGRPALSPPARYDTVSTWLELLKPGHADRTKGSRQRPEPAERNFTATMERAHRMLQSQPFKPLDEVVRTLLSDSSGAQFDYTDLGILGIPIRTDPDANGGRIGGCLFGLVHAHHLDIPALEDLVRCTCVFLQWRPESAIRPLSATASGGAAEELLPDATEQLIQWANDHNLLRDAIIALRKEKPGMKMKMMRIRHSRAYSVFLKYSLQQHESDIEKVDKTGTLMQHIWCAMTATDSSYLYQARKLAGLPSLKPPKRRKAANA